LRLTLNCAIEPVAMVSTTQPLPRTVKFAADAAGTANAAARATSARRFITTG